MGKDKTVSSWEFFNFYVQVIIICHLHLALFWRYFDAVQAKEQRRQQRLRVHTSYDVENGEFLCPLCECLSNTVIPLLPPPRVLFNRSVWFINVLNKCKKPRCQTSYTPEDLPECLLSAVLDCLSIYFGWWISLC